MTPQILTLLGLLLAAAAPAPTPPPSPTPPTTESVRLRRFFEEHWAGRLRDSPELATYRGAPNDGWSDLSPERTARAYATVRENLASLSAIDRSRLTAAEQVDYDLFRRRLEMSLEGQRFDEIWSYLQIDHMGGIDLQLVQLLDYMPARTVADYEAILARLRGLPPGGRPDPRPGWPRGWRPGSRRRA